ncbi:DUF1415 domain-containing protein [Parahaliea aestuarii]|uniref:DUF1415 domain-containing protein n=1 Tax=Parahaliea aestuarii TaxID=1852021 RepID=A0A5C8ZY14_9GAMM|nr:DUF1415 domain-containing protein [Parahaliea aestuarii]TXS92410.1 DUF1415 domain-containing protein [Parahaliea aestuarii]
MSPPPVPGAVERQTRAWLAEFVVGLNLCPFARPLLDSPALRISVSTAAERAALQRAFLQELDKLQSTPEAEIATTLLVFPRALASFDDYLDFLDEAQFLLEQAGLDGVVQLASFHPDYCFEGEAESAASHFSNRSPWPTIHLLREAMVTRLVTGHPDPEAIPGANVEHLNALGRETLETRWQALFD